MTRTHRTVTALGGGALAMTVPAISHAAASAIARRRAPPGSVARIPAVAVYARLRKEIYLEIQQQRLATGTSARAEVNEALKRLGSD